jgi:ABC-type Na+ efflux pump permease subunit
VNAIWLLARKDLRTLARSRPVLFLFAIYPIALALLLGILISDSGEPSIALVNEDKSGSSVTIGDKKFGIDTYKKQAEESGVEIVELDRDEALRALDEGQVAGVLLIPNGSIAKLRTQLSPTTLRFYTGDTALGATTTQRVRGVIYNINLDISEALVETNAEYLKTLVTGGTVEVNGDEFDLYGLDPVSEDLTDLKDRIDDESDRDTLDDAIDFADKAGIGLELADNALEATAAPIRLERASSEGKSIFLTAQALSFALAVALMFICTILVASSLAGERDDRVLGRLLRSSVSGWQVLVSKLLFGATIGMGFATGLFVVFAVLERQHWERLPLLAVATIIASISASTIGTLLATITRDARVATLVALLVVLPLVPLTLLPTSPLADSISQLMPLEPARKMFNGVLFDTNPVDAIRQGTLHLLAIAAIAGTLSVRFLRRLI